MIAEETIGLTTLDGVSLEGRISVPDRAIGGAVLCHPHPLYGGDMDNPVVVRCQEVFASLGLATLRFNFRGVGASTGSHGQGVAERLDVEAAMAGLQTAAPGAGQLVLMGYSFGAAVAAHVATKGERLRGLCLVGPPLTFPGFDLPSLVGALVAPTLVVAGSQDEYCPLSVLRVVGDQLPSAQVSIVEGANHFFFGKLFPLGETLAAWLRSAVGLQSGQPGRGGGTG